TDARREFVAIEWNTAALGQASELALTQGRLELRHCALRGMAAGVRCEWGGALALQFDNVLHLGPGPLVRLNRMPRLDEPIQISLAHATLRAAASLLTLRYAAAEAEPGRIAVTANDCVLALDPQGSLLHFLGTQPPARLLAALEWHGQGSVLAPPGVLAAWQTPGGSTEPVEAARLRIAGLVKSDVGFAGAPRDAFAASRAVRWQVPLRSPDPPGIDETRLP
ncbi:MAG: hypothetical protein JNG90_11105, partial [Planctomycetaceae bacterium]|nr:hypothetical protein [Planctomycetaceae bacterium]